MKDRLDRALPRHDFLDHTSEVTLRIRARTFPEVIEEATRAFAELVPSALWGEKEEAGRRFRIAAPDRTSALVEWLNEIVYLCEAEQWLPTEVEATSEEEGEVTVRARGVGLTAPFVLVKAATLHHAGVRQRGDGLEAEVTLDV